MRRMVIILLVGVITPARSFSQPATTIHSIPLPEVSGAVNMGNDQVLLIADEGYHVELVAHAEAAFKEGDVGSAMHPLTPTMNGSKESKRILDDIEDIAWDSSRNAAFLITSHSRNRTQDQVIDPKDKKPERHKLARIILEDGHVTTQETDVLEEGLKTFSFVRAA